MTKQQRKPAAPTPPAHLRPATRQWFSYIVKNFELDSHHLRLLILAAESWDRCEQAREGLKDGLTFTDRWGSPKPKPEVAIEASNKIAFARLIRELDLDGAVTPSARRPPALISNRR